MNCEQVQELLSPYIDNVLEAEEKCRIARHLEMCGECSNEYATLLETVNLLKTLGDEELPEGFNDRLMDRLRACRRSRNRIPAWLPTGAVAAILVILFLGLSPGHFLTDDLFLESVNSPKEEMAAEPGGSQSSREADVMQKMALVDESEESSAPDIFTAGDPEPPEATGPQEVKTVERPDSELKISNRSNETGRTREDSSSKQEPGGDSDTGVAMEAPVFPGPGGTNGSPETEMRITSARFYDTPEQAGPYFIKMSVADLGFASRIITDIANSFGGSVQQYPTTPESAGREGFFLVQVPYQSLRQFIDALSVLGEISAEDVIGEAVLMETITGVTNLKGLEDTKETLEKQLAKTEGLEAEKIRQEISRIEKEIREIKSGAGAGDKKGELIEINIIVKEKGK